MIQKLLIANRGEIACRIARTCRRLGVAVSTVHSAADRDALHVRDIGESIYIGAAPAAQSYLNGEAILKAAAEVGATAIHPGIGFLSEDPAFAEAVEVRGLIYVGPRPDTLRRFADKSAAKHEARQAGVPVIGGGEGSSTDAAAIKRMIRDDMHLPVVLKAAAGGGGRGVRVVRSLDGLLAIIESAMREAQSSFGRPDLIVEEFVENARHLEIQVAGDGRGSVIHLFERECSLQRRFQKIIEEAPASNLSAEQRRQITADAVKLARQVDYRNLGTIEFLVADDRHYFLECNPRLQVEHTVTEEVTGLDLVELQLKIAAHCALPFAQEQIRVNGHAIQARVYAEDSAAGFIPSTGRLQRVDFPFREARVETGVETGSEITPHYDSMIAKLIVNGANRAQALDRIVAAVEETVVFGVETNLGFLAELLKHPVVQAGAADNCFIDHEMMQTKPSAHPERDTVVIAAELLLEQWNKAGADASAGLWAGDGALLGWHYTDGTELLNALPVFSLTGPDGRVCPVAVGLMSPDGMAVSIDGDVVKVLVKPLGDDRYHVVLGRRVMTVVAKVSENAVLVQGPFGVVEFTVVPFLSLEAAEGLLSGQVRAPMMGAIAKVNVRPGDSVNVGDILVVQESMKMELVIEAPCSGKVVAVNCAQGDMVERHQVLVDITPCH